MKVTLKQRILAITLCIAMLVTTVNLNDLFQHKFHAATVNDKTLEDFMDEVSTLYEDTEVQEMSPDITFSKESEDTVVVDDTIMVPVDVATENVDIDYSDIKQDIVTQDSQDLIAVEDIAKNSDYEAVENNDESITLSKIYQSKTLIVKSSVQIDTYDAETVISGWGDLYILKFSTEQDTKKAYEKLLKNDYIDSVEIDSILSSETLSEIEESISTEEVEPTVDEVTTDVEEIINTEESVKASETSIEDAENTETSESETEISSEETSIETIEDETVKIPDGIIVAIIDSGIDKNNSLFADRIVDLGLNLSTSGEGIQDDNGHGTAVASIIAKNSNAYLMPIKIANSEGKGTALSLYLAIQAAIENEADIINISLTTGNSDLLTSVIAECEEKGIKVIAAAGNQSANVENYAPANIESVITVAATDKEYNPASYSNYGELIDYAALGEMEVETINGKTVMTGTSLSAAYVTAVIAKSLETGEDFSNYVYSNGENLYLGKGVVSLEEIKLPEKETIEIEGFDFKIKQSLINNSRDDYKIEILTNEDVEYTFNGGLTWQKSNYIEINRNEEFYEDGGYLTSVRTLGIKDNNANITYKNFTVIDFINENIEEQEITLSATTIDSKTTLTGTNATWDSSVGTNHDYVKFNWSITDTSTTDSCAANTATLIGHYAKGTGTTSTLYNGTKIKYNSTTYTLRITAIGNGTNNIMYKDSTSAADITTYIIPKYVKTINKNAFKDCTKIATVKWQSGGNSTDGYTYTNGVSNECLEIKEYAFYGCSALTAFTVGTGVTTIGNRSFYECTSLATLTFTKTSAVTSIGEYAFYNCTALTTIKGDGTSGSMPASLRTIGQYAFYNCDGLTSLKYGANLYSIGQYAFNNCSALYEFTDGTEGGCAHLNEKITSIGNYAFGSTLIYNIRVLCPTAGGLVSSSQNVRCFKGSTAETKAKSSSAHVVYITNSTKATATNNAKQWVTLFSKIGRYKINYTGASSYYYENEQLTHKSLSNLNMHNLEYNHTTSFTGNSSGAYLDKDSESTIKAAYLIYEPGVADKTYYPLVADYYVTLSYSSTKKTTNFTPSHSIEFKPTAVMYYNANVNGQAYIDVTDFVKEHGQGYYYVANISHRHGTSDESASWKIIYVEENVNYPLRATLVNAINEYVTSAEGDGWKNSGTAIITLPSGLQTKTSSTAYMEFLYGMSNADAVTGVNQIQYSVDSGTRSWTTNPTVMNGSYYIRSTNIPCRLLFTKNGLPLEQIRNISTGEYYLDHTTLTSATKATTFSTTETIYPATGSDTELLTNLVATGGQTQIAARVRANGRVLVLNSLALAVDIEGFTYNSTQTTTVNSPTSVTVTGKSTNTTKDTTGQENIGIIDGTYVIYLDSGLTITSASGNNNGTAVTGTIDNANHTVTFTGINTLTQDTYFSYTINCSTSNSGKTVFKNVAKYNGYYYNNGEKTDYIEQATNATSTATPKYILTINPNTGSYSGSTSSQQFIQNSGTTKSISTPTKTGHFFKGWTLSGGGSLSGSTYTYGGSNGTLTANWEIGTYTVTYNGNGADSGSVASHSFTYGNSVSIKDNAFVKDGYIFLGWNTSSLGTGTNYTAGTKYSSGSNLTLYAQWGKAHNLTVKPNGGTWNGKTVDSIFEMARSQQKAISIPTRTNYKFTGWTVSNGETEYDDTIVISGYKFICVDKNYNDTGNALYVMQNNYGNNYYMSNENANTYANSLIYSRLRSLGNTLYNANNRILSNTIKNTVSYAFVLSPEEAEKYAASVNLKNSWTSEIIRTQIVELTEDPSKPTGITYEKTTPVCGKCGSTSLTLQFGTTTTKYPNYICKDCSAITYIIKDTTKNLCVYDNTALTASNDSIYKCTSGHFNIAYNCPSCYSPKTIITGETSSSFTVECKDCTKIFEIAKVTTKVFTCTSCSSTEIRLRCNSCGTSGFNSTRYKSCPNCSSADLTALQCYQCGGTSIKTATSTAKTYTCTACDNDTILMRCTSCGAQGFSSNRYTSCPSCSSTSITVMYCPECGSSSKVISQISIKTTEIIDDSYAYCGECYGTYFYCKTHGNWYGTNYALCPTCNNVNNTYCKTCGTSTLGNIKTVEKEYSALYCETCESTEYIEEYSSTSTNGPGYRCTNCSNVKLTVITEENNSVYKAYIVNSNNELELKSLTDYSAGIYPAIVLAPSENVGNLSSLTTASTFTMGDADVTLTANWRAAINYTVTYNGNGATSGSVASQTFQEDNSVKISANGFTKTGYTFTGWNTKADGTGTSYDVGDTYNKNENVTLYAQWKINSYTVTYNGNGSTGGSTASQTFNYGSSVKIASNGFTKTDYEFVSWNTKADGSGTTYRPGQTYATNANLTLYAQWKLAKIDIDVSIVWDDENNNIEGLFTGVRPAKVVLKLMNGSTVVKTATVTGNNTVPATSNTWDYTFTGLDKFDSNGNVITYKVVEEQPSCLDASLKYEVSYSSDTYTITNKLTQPVKTIEAYKVVGTITWLDENDKYHFRPGSVVIELHQNGKKIKEIEVPEGTTTYRFTDLKKYDDNFKLYEYKVVERDVDNYSITYEAYETSVTETDSLGNKIITTTLHYDITNTFTPDEETIRKNDNVLSLTPYIKNGNSNVTDKDYLAACADKTENIFVTLKQMDMEWTAVDAKNGKYAETYKNTYSGIEFNILLNVGRTSTMTDIMCGKYEIVVADNKSFDFKNIEEITGKNAVFSYENGKYYVTFSYAYEEASKDLAVNFTLDNFNGYESTCSAKNLYQLFLKKED